MSRVRHPEHGQGTVLVARDGVATVEFDAGPILKVDERDLVPVVAGLVGLERPTWDAPLATTLKALALAIRSTNERWGVFSRSRVALLPHQLWVCHRVLSRWPARWLIADDVGLGKTIEAGLILTPLLAQDHVRRLLVVVPAPLVDQWIKRLRDLFDIRAARYHPEVDRPQDDFWQVHRQVVASMHTLRLDHKERWARLMDAEPWDLVLVDEAHHLSADEDGTRTLGLRLLEEMDARGLIGGLLLFTGTPHRGKDYSFLALLRLLDDSIDPDDGIGEVLDRLPALMIRNNKQNVTDMGGARLFQAPVVEEVRYRYLPEEAEFYDRLTEFILTGRAYASGSHLRTQRSVMLVLTTLQKLASSSVAAVRRALEGRLERLRRQDELRPAAQAELDRLWRQLAASPDQWTLNEDQRANLEEKIDELMETIQLNPEEIPALEELVALASRVTAESRITRLMELVEGLPGEPAVLLFTEYKATQALVVSALGRRYGFESVGFINGDNTLVGVLGGDGRPQTLRSDRQAVATAFNRGEIRFLVSTEAAGEGVDLQQSCHLLVHVDLPWNPMRMHQRVGRLNRYGQAHQVHVYLLRNPDTVEGRIWALLEEKLQRIGLAFRGTMADPEDILSLVLGLASPATHERIAAQALGVNKEAFDQWYDAQTTSFGGEDAIDVVKALIGHTARFDFSTDTAGMPQVDLGDLLPFLRAALRLRGRRMDEKDDGSFVFKTPEEWMRVHHAVRDRYHAHLDRARREERRGPAMLGAGHRVMEAALADLADIDAMAATVDGVAAPLLIFACQDALSAPGAPWQRVVLAAELQPDGGFRVLPDWEVVLLCNQIVERPDRVPLKGESSPLGDVDAGAVDRARAAVAEALPSLDLPFKRPDLRLEVVLCPPPGASDSPCSA